METKIVMLKLSELEAHPDNPRKNIGDVSELADSIRESGIMQNLTVVPHEGKYRVVIGHRRMAAAKMAGLTEVPCVIADMDYKTQISTMLTENMNRSDLTVVEQAEGIQMMFDMGEDINTVVKKTGLSRTTVERRKTLAQFDLKKVAESFEKGATLDDYIKVAQIENEEDREEALRAIGTNNFDWKIKRAKELKGARIKWAKAEELLDGKAKKAKFTYSDHEQITYANFNYPEWESKVKDAVERFADGEEYFYQIEKGCWGEGNITIFRKKAKGSNTKTEENKKFEELQKRKTELSNLREKIKDSHIEFAKGIKISSYNELKSFFTFFLKKVWNFDIEDVLENYEFDTEDEDCEIFELEEVKEILKNPEALAMVSLIDDEFPEVIWDYYGKYNGQRVEEYEEMLKRLEEFGYVQSDEEKAFFNGTHELYVQEKEK